MHFDVGHELGNQPVNQMRKRILSLTFILIGLAIPVLQSYWVRQIITLDSAHKDFGIPAYVSVKEDRARSETTVHQESLFIHFAIVISFGFLAGRVWPRGCKHNGQQGVTHQPA